MQRCVEYNFLSRSYRLMYNGAAMFALNEKFPGLEGVFETIMESTPSGTDALYDVWLILASNGEAVKKWLGYEAVPLPEKDELAAMSAVDDLARMRDAVAAAIMAGLGREYESKAKVIDLGLEELEKERKKKQA